MFQVIKLGVTPEAAQTTPGGAPSFALTVRNASSIVDRYHFAVEGVPAEWTQIEPAVVSLFPGAEARAVLTVRPPAGVEAVAGTYPLTCRATSEDDPSVSTSVGLTLTIGTVGALALEVYPPEAQGRGATYRLRLRNGANQVAAVDLSARDNEEGLLFDIAPLGTIQVPAGGEVEATARVVPKVKETIGQPHPYEIEFTATAREEEGGTGPSRGTIGAAGLVGQARFTYEPRVTALAAPRWLRALPPWLLALLALLLGLLLLLAGAGAGAVLAHGTAAQPVAAVVKPTPAKVAGLPVVKAFGLNTKPKGGLALGWKTVGAKGVTLDGKPAPANGELPVSLNRTATHVLTVTGAGGTMVRVLRLIAPMSTPVAVNQRPTMALLPKVKAFTARADARSSKLDLVWSVTGAQTVTLDGHAAAPSGRTIVSWVGGRAHTLRAVNALGAVASTVILPTTALARPVQVVVMSPPTIKNFSLQHLRGGRSYQLSWHTREAAKVTLDGHVVAAQGILRLLPLLKSSVHILVAQNANGRATARVHIVVVHVAERIRSYVLALPRVLRFTLDSATGGATVNWRVLGASKVLVQGHGVGAAGTVKGVRGEVRLVAMNDVGVVAEIVAAPTPMPTETRTTAPATATPAASATPLPSPTVIATRTPHPTATATMTPTPRPTATATMTQTPRPTATRTPRPAATATPRARPTVTAMPTQTPRPTKTATQTPRSTATATRTPRPTETATRTPRPTATRTPHPTATATPRPTATATATRTPRPTATATRTPRPTATATRTPRPTATRTPRPTATRTPRPTATATARPTATRVVEPSPKPLATPTRAVEPSPKPLATPTRVVEPTPKPF